MHCLFRLLSLPIIPLGQGMRGTGVMEVAAGGDWYSVYTLLENRTSAAVQSSGSHLFQMIEKHPGCQILPIFGADMRHLIEK